MAKFAHGISGIPCKWAGKGACQNTVTPYSLLLFLDLTSKVMTDIRSRRKGPDTTNVYDKPLPKGKSEVMGILERIYCLV